MFFTNWVGADVVNPVVNVSISGKGKNGAWFGWPEDAKLEALRDAFAHVLLGRSAEDRDRDPEGSL